VKVGTVTDILVSVRWAAPGDADHPFHERNRRNRHPVPKKLPGGGLALRQHEPDGFAVGYGIGAPPVGEPVEESEPTSVLLVGERVAKVGPRPGTAVGDGDAKESVMDLRVELVRGEAMVHRVGHQFAGQQDDLVDGVPVA
jgi:hypothetical protein